MGTRSGAQIRSHAQKFFIKNKKESASNETVEEAEEQTSSVTPSSPSENYSYFFSKMYLMDYLEFATSLMKRISIFGVI